MVHTVIDNRPKGGGLNLDCVMEEGPDVSHIGLTEEGFRILLQELP